VQSINIVGELLSVTVPAPIPVSVKLNVSEETPIPEMLEGAPSKANHVLPPFGIGVVKLTEPVLRLPLMLVKVLSGPA
jgi:hypothetical protein